MRILSPVVHRKGRPSVETVHTEFPSGRTDIRSRRIDVQNPGKAVTSVRSNPCGGRGIRDAERGIAHPVLAAHHFGVPQDRGDRRIRMTVCPHSRYPHASFRENSIVAVSCCRGGITPDKTIKCDLLARQAFRILNTSLRAVSRPTRATPHFC